MKIKTAIIVDFMGSGELTDRDEIAEHKRNYTKFLKPHKAEFYRAYSPYPGEHGIRDGTDLVIYDFGGMLPGCSDLLESNARELVRWAAEHPSCLVVVASKFTYQSQIEVEMRERDLVLPNIVLDMCSGGNPVPSWFLEKSK